MKKTPRKHQINALNAININVEGIIHLPTGTGKTFIQALAIKNNIQKRKVYVVLSPRILLTNQLYSEIRDELLVDKIDCQYLIVHSGRPEDNEDIQWGNEQDESINLPYREVIATTSSIEIKNKYNIAIEENVPLIIFGTYDSADRIIKAGIPVEFLFCDEAHHIVTEEFTWIRHESNDNVDKYFDANKKIYFTATLKNTISDEGLGMNNRQEFGEIIYSETPAKMISAGEIVRPRMHLVNSDSKSGNSIDRDVNAIIDAFDEHKIHCKVAPKLLVVCKNTDHLNNIVHHPRMKKMLESTPHLKMFDISSEHGARINNVDYKRDAFLKELKTMDERDPAIIFHIRILTEGIDVPGITGIMPMNNMKLSEFLQNLGRATRLYTNDRTRLYSNKMKPTELDRFVKPYAWVIVPTFGVIGDDIKENIKNMVFSLRHYGFNPAEDVVIKEKNGKAAPVSLDMLNNVDKVAMQFKDDIYDIVHEIEEQEEADRLSYEEIQLAESIKNKTVDEIINDAGLWKF